MEKRSNEELAVLAQSGDGVAFERLWKQTEGFVVSEIKKLKDDYNFEIKRHMQDLKLCGKVGIARGMERFDITRGCTFLTYAGWWVKKELMLFMDEEIKHQQEIPMSSCFAEIYQMERQYFKKDTNIRAVEDTYIREQRLKILEKSLATMPPRERFFAKYRYGFVDEDNRSIRRMREEFNLTMQEFRDLEKRVFEYLHECLSDFCVYPWEGEYVDIEARQAQEAESYWELFENPVGDYLSNMIDMFQTEWEYECECAM